MSSVLGIFIYWNDGHLPNGSCEIKELICETSSFLKLAASYQQFSLHNHRFTLSLFHREVVLMRLRYYALREV